MLSRVSIRNQVTFPAFLAEKVYMEPFLQKEGLPKNLARWQNTVDIMLDSIKTSLPIYLMIDQGVVAPNTFHRREGLHIDGCWIEAGHRGHRGHISAHGPTHKEPPPYRGYSGGHGDPSNKSHCLSSYKETLLLASNVIGCVGYEGEFIHPEWKEGDRSSLDSSKFNKIVFESGRVYGGDTMSMLHESIPVQEMCQRTVIRLNVPGISLWESIH